MVPILVTFRTTRLPICRVVPIVINIVTSHFQNKGSMLSPPLMYGEVLQTQNPIGSSLDIPGPSWAGDTLTVYIAANGNLGCIHLVNNK